MSADSSRVKHVSAHIRSWGEKRQQAIKKAQILREQRAKQGEAAHSTDERECVVCMSALRATRFKPCGHSQCCESCANALLKRPTSNERRCPYCRADIHGMIISSDISVQHTFDGTTAKWPGYRNVDVRPYTEGTRTDASPYTAATDEYERLHHQRQALQARRAELRRAQARDQISALRSELLSWLGAPTFERAHGRLQMVMEEDDEEALVLDIQDILGAANLEALPKILSLIYLEKIFLENDMMHSGRN